jgi:hypothetical protein
MSKKPNRFVVEVQGGIVLFFNRATEVADGWWWGSDADPLQQGPFASSEEAVADARPDGDKLELVTWSHRNNWGENELRPTGHVVLIDTRGRLLVRTGERPAREDWKPRH